MNIYAKVLWVIYLVMIVVIGLFIVWNVFKSKKLTDKFIGAVALIMFVLRILMIK